MKARDYIEVLTPKQNVEDLDGALERFVDRVQTVVHDGYVVSVPDNPMGTVHFEVLDVLGELDVEVPPRQLLVHLNTFHTKEGMDNVLRTADEKGIEQLLAVSGDGGERLPRLHPESIGFDGNAVTSVELLRYIHREYPGRFSTGVAFNQYEPAEHEIEKLSRKLEAGAQFVITQPVLANGNHVGMLRDFGIPVSVGAWMSRRIQLLSECIGYDVNAGGQYDPVQNLTALREGYPDFGTYLALVSFKNQLPLLPSLLGRSHAV
jgi:methylenetetrahydrofolate reductase (NADPH)